MLSRILIGLAILGILSACAKYARYDPVVRKRYEEVLEPEGIVRAWPNEMEELEELGAVTIGIAYFDGRDNRRRPLDAEVANRASVEGGTHAVPIRSETDRVYFPEYNHRTGTKTAGERYTFTDYAIVRVPPHCWSALKNALRPRTQYTVEGVDFSKKCWKADPDWKDEKRW